MQLLKSNKKSSFATEKFHYIRFVRISIVNKKSDGNLLSGDKTRSIQFKEPEYNHSREGTSGSRGSKRVDST